MHRQRFSRQLVFLLPIVLGLSCAKEIEVVPAPTGLTVVVFDPSTTPAQVPAPTDLAVDQTTGLLAVPVADATKDPAQAYFDTFLNTLNGYPPTATAEVHFSGELDKASINEKTMPVFEMDPANPSSISPVTGLTYEYKKVSDTDTMVRVWNYAGWTRGMRYVFYVVGGASGVKNAGGKPVIRSALFELAMGDNPLCAWDKDKSWDSTTMTCATPGVGGKAIGCCTFNYSALVESSVKAEVRAKNTDKTSEEVESLVKSTVLQKATDFERLRRGFEPLAGLAAAAKINKDDISVLWSFKVVDMNQAVFNPSAVPPQVPTPTDLIRDPKTGLLAIPDGAGISEAEKEWNTYLRSLNGYPTGSTGSLSFAAALDSTFVDKGIHLYELDQSTTPPTMTKATGITATFDDASSRVLITHAGGFNRATTYVVVAVGSDTGLKNKDTTLADYPWRTALMHLVLSPHPLCEQYDAASASCGTPLVSSFIDDPTDKTGALTGKQKAAAFETIRQGYDPLVTLLTATDTSIKREEIAALWTFTVTSQSEVIYDPTTGVIPFPNDVLIDQTTGKVNIPATPGETPTEKALREGLNTLDGFTTQGMYYAVYAGKVDTASATSGALTLDVTALAPVDTLTIAVDDTAGAITATPNKPLKEKNRYAVVLISKYKAGDLASQGGLKDDKGRYLVPSSFMALLRNRHPVYDTTAKKSLISTVDDATAAQVEEARTAYKELFDGLELLMQIKREDIVAAWTFTTQTITEPLIKLRALPWSILAAIDSNAPVLTGTVSTDFTNYPVGVPTDIGAWVPDGKFTTWMDLNQGGAVTTYPPDVLFSDPTQGKPVEVPFWMTIPTGTMPTGGWPVVLFQHGLGNHKAAVVDVANTLAGGGYATIAFDIIYHGARSWCTKDDECDAGGTCTVSDGTCSTSLKDTDGDGNPDASGGDKFLNTSNPFAVRDSMRQHVVDAAALLRAIALGGASGITGATVQLDPTQVHYVGESLGSILGTLVLATDSLPQRAVLAVPGAPLSNIFLAPNGSPEFQDTKNKVLAAMGVTEGSIEYLQLLTTFNWIMDPADPGNFARYVKTDQLVDLVQTTDPLNPVLVPKKEVIIQLAEQDKTIPPVFGDYIAAAMGVDTTKTEFIGQDHTFLRKASPDPTATTAAQAQMGTFLTTGDVCTPVVTSGSYTGVCTVVP